MAVIDIKSKYWSWEEYEKELRSLIKRLESLSKPLNELIVEEKFNVNGVLVETYTHSITPLSELVIGGKSSTYKTGYSSRAILEVTPYRPNIPVKTLYFNGFSVVKAGDVILAKIPKYREEKVEDPDNYGLYESSKRIFYLDRDFKPEEKAIEITILSSEGKKLRVERSVDYNLFIKNK